MAFFKDDIRSEVNYCKGNFKGSKNSRFLVKVIIVEWVSTELASFMTSSKLQLNYLENHLKTSGTELL